MKAAADVGLAVLTGIPVAGVARRNTRNEAGAFGHGLLS